MNKTDVIAKVSEKSGIAADACEKIIEAFEEQAEAALIDRFKGVKDNRADMAAGISEKTGLALEDCEKVVATLDDVMDTGLSDKLKIFKRQ